MLFLSSVTEFNIFAIHKELLVQQAGFRKGLPADEHKSPDALQRIITSELPRTRETAAIINRWHRLPIEVNALLNDIRTGFDGRPVGDYFTATAHDPLHARANGGESLLDYKARVVRFIEWLKTQPQDCILVVAHEETLRVFDAWFRALPDAALRSLQFANCALQRYRL